MRISTLSNGLFGFPAGNIGDDGSAVLSVNRSFDIDSVSRVALERRSACGASLAVNVTRLLALDFDLGRVAIHNLLNDRYGRIFPCGAEAGLAMERRAVDLDFEAYSQRQMMLSSAFVKELEMYFLVLNRQDQASCCY